MGLRPICMSSTATWSTNHSQASIHSVPSPACPAYMHGSTHHEGDGGYSTMLT